MLSMLGRSFGFIGPQTFQRAETNRRVRSLQVVTNTCFDGSYDSETKDVEASDFPSFGDPPAHPTGVNCITIDGSQNRFLLSGGADATIKLWDLDDASYGPEGQATYRPIGVTPKSLEGHQFGITTVSFYPIDSGAFLSSSYDKTLQVWDTNTLQSAISFPIPGQIYAHDVSSIASHLLVAVAAHDSFVRLIDLDSGASTHTLPGHEGAVLSVAWSPIREHILISSGADGTVRLWDIRSAGSVLGLLDYEDTVGIMGNGAQTRDAASVQRRRNAKAHVGPCNGAVFSGDGMHIVTCGHDERVRVWDASTGANSLVHFGPAIRNRVLASIKPILVPSNVTEAGRDLLLFPNGPEILILDVHEGTLVRRLRGISGASARSRKEKTLKHRVTSMCWRHGHCEAYSANSNGFIKALIPDVDAFDMQEESEDELEAENRQGEQVDEMDRKRKRQELDQLHRDLIKQKITFT